jgi:hypothetical protein
MSVVLAVIPPDPAIIIFQLGEELPAYIRGIHYTLEQEAGVPFKMDLALVIAKDLSTADEWVDPGTGSVYKTLPQKDTTPIGNFTVDLPFRNPTLRSSLRCASNSRQPQTCHVYIFFQPSRETLHVLAERDGKICADLNNLELRRRDGYYIDKNLNNEPWIHVELPVPLGPYVKTPLGTSTSSAVGLGDGGGDAGQ